MLKAATFFRGSIPKAFAVGFPCLLASIAFAQGPFDKSAALASLFDQQRPTGKQIRLHVALLRVPMKDAAQALMADKGETPLFWRTQLNEWQQSGLLESVIEFRNESEEIRESPLRAAKFRFIGQGAASHFWMEHQGAKEEKASPPDPNDLLQELSEDDVGNQFTATLTMRHGWQQADVHVQAFHCPQPKTRPTPSWPLPVLSAPRYLFRPWSLNAYATAPVNEPFLLGTQMEAPEDGQIHTGHVIMAFGRITLPEKNGRELTEEQADLDPPKHLQSWSLAVDQKVFLSWFAARESSDHDGETLQSWLQKAGDKSGVELLATAAAAAKGGCRAELASALRWQDARGFEPGGTRTEFRALSCEDDTYSLRHELSMELQRGEATDVELSRDPFANSPTHKRLNPTWMVDLISIRPSVATTWKKWKSAMERNEQDPDAIEVAEADLDESGERVQARLNVLPGRVALAGACLKKDRVHATFIRLVEARDRTPKAAVSPAPAKLDDSTTTTWIIETPVSWQNKLLSPSGFDAQGLARELLDSAKAGSASIIGFGHQGQLKDSEGRIAATEPRIFFGGAYVNTALALKGIFFNTRNVEQEKIGDMFDIRSVNMNRSLGGMLDMTLRSMGSPEWRHWGLWQPALQETNAKNSGIEQPVFPANTLKLVATLKPRMPQVIAVMRQSHLGSLKTDTTPTLRWYVARREAPPEPPAIPGAHASFADYIEDPQTVQALVLKINPTRVLPTDPAATAKTLLGEAQQGDLPILDLITLQKTGSSPQTAATGWDYHFTNGRDRLPKESHTDVFKASLKMPPDTRFASQVDLRNRIVGFHLEVEGAEWKIERDALPPQIVTDTFQNARLEWPYPEIEKLPPVAVSVQRPIFSIQEAKGDLPKKGGSSVTRLSEDTILVLRVLP